MIVFLCLFFLFPPSHLLATPPRLLSETDLYQDIENEVLNDSIKEYEVRFPLYSSFYYKRRFILLPEGTSVVASNMDVWEFPEDTKIWKEFGYKNKQGIKIKVETRLMQKTGPDWVFQSYVWHDNQKDALLWNGEDGQSPIDLTLKSNKKYRIPSKSQCLTCHAQEQTQRPVLGFSNFQLPRDFIETLLLENLLDSSAILWSKHDILARTPKEEQVIGYFHGNCAHCHQPLRKDILGANNFNVFYSMENIKVLEDVPVLALINKNYTNFGVPWSHHSDSRSSMLTPQAPEQSMIYYRMNKAPGHFKMPALTEHKKDSVFIKTVLKEWIKSL